MRYELSDIMNEHRWFIMGLAMIAIVLFHQPWFDWGPFAFFHRTGFFGVEVFLFVSGWGIYQSLTKNTIGTFYKNRIMRLMPTCILIGVIQAILSALGWNNGVSHPAAYMLMCVGLFKWFVYAILCYYAVAPGVYRILIGPAYKFGLFSIIVFAILFLCRKYEYLWESSLLSVVPNIIYRFPAFLFGMWMARRGDYFHLTVKIGIITCIIWIYMAYDGFSSYYHVVWNSISFIASIPLLVYATSWLGSMMNKSTAYQCTKLIGMSSLEVYLWHDFFFRGFFSISNISPCIQVMSSVLSTIISVIATRYIISLLFHSKQNK